jgi:hypothetical protein
MEECNMDSMKLYRLVEVELSGSPATLEPGRFVAANDDGVALAVEVDRTLTARSLAAQLDEASVHQSRWFRPAPEGTA